MAGHTKFLSLLLFLCTISFTLGGRYIPTLGLVFEEVPTSDLISISLEQSVGKKKLFVFGDSYVDTGNAWPGVGAWKVPYGTTFPGHPTGRSSDGRVLTDYLASFLGIDTPLSWYYRNGTDKIQWESGMNFALGGSGVFDTAATTQNLSVRVGRFKELIDQNSFTKSDLESSVAFVYISRGDYAEYLNKNHSMEELESYIPTVIKELSADLKILHDLGVPKVAVSLLAPIGCTPQYANHTTCPNYPQNCDQVFNSIVKKHNEYLKNAVEKLNECANEEAFVLIDVYTAFVSAMDQHAKIIENTKYQNPTIACCKGEQVRACGKLDAAGNKLYTVCEHPELSFFWDDFNPSQHGWSLVFSALGDSLNQLL